LTDATSPEAAPDFDAAEMYVRMAREAHAAGDGQRFTAASKMVAVALCMTDEPACRFHLGHLPKS
jgi:hypothetical protein